MEALVFSRTQSASANCQAQVWRFQLDRNYAYVVDVKRRSGDGQYKMELRDAKGGIITTTQSSIEGRGILVAKTDAGNYSLLIAPTTSSGDWNYTITLWKGMPSLSFVEVQSSHSSGSSEPNVTTWRYTMTGPDTYRVEIKRTDGNLEYDVSVLDASLKPIATAKSDEGDASVELKTSGKVYYVMVMAKDGTSGSYNITLVR